jgi:hypothetical protein
MAEKYAELEHLYWKTLTFASPMYGADTLRSVFSEKTTQWNIYNLKNILSKHP